MSIVEFDGSSSWSLDESEAGESTKCPVGRGGGVYSVVKGGGGKRETVTTSLCLVLTALVAPAKKPKEHRFQKNFLEIDVILVVCLLLVVEHWF